MSLVKGLHHVALKCSGKEQFEEAKHFYGEVLGLPVARSWEGGIMFDTGAGLMEIFNTNEIPLPTGTIRHFAFAVEDPDACVKAVSEAGYEVFIEPKDIVIASEVPFPARIAFCRGPLGEEIEFFHEK